MNLKDLYLILIISKLSETYISENIYPVLMDNYGI